MPGRIVPLELHSSQLQQRLQGLLERFNVALQAHVGRIDETVCRDHAGNIQQRLWSVCSDTDASALKGCPGVLGMENE